MPDLNTTGASGYQSQSNTQCAESFITLPRKYGLWWLASLQTCNTFESHRRSSKQPPRRRQCHDHSERFRSPGGNELMKLLACVHGGQSSFVEHVTAHLDTNWKVITADCLASDVRRRLRCKRSNAKNNGGCTHIGLTGRLEGVSSTLGHSSTHH